ncbi:MAG: hypothetical protein NVV62_13755 [Terricaulis sp.]|nr:hypothetical protein [Terricaulis sp.]
MSRKRWMLIIGVALAGVVLPGLIWSLQDEVTYARIATTYAAKQTCSCLHVSGRALESCLADFPSEGQGLIDVKPEGQSVRASVLFGAISAEAIYEDGFGCAIGG